MNHLQEYIKSVICELEAKKRSRNIVPDGVVMRDLQNRFIADIKTELNELCRQKVIEHYRTINSVAFKIKPGQEQ